jgi:hypothetical protein
MELWDEAAENGFGAESKKKEKKVPTRQKSPD